MIRRSLRLAYAGTPEFAATILSALLADGRHRITDVYTQPDRPAGRGRKIVKSPVKQLAEGHGLRVHQPIAAAEIDMTGQLAQADALIVVAFGLLLPVAILNRPRLGCLNLHASLLPRWRGAAPIQRAIAAGDPITGISIMQMDAGLDTGDILMQESCRIRDDDTCASLRDRLATLGAESLIKTLDGLAVGSVARRKQDDDLATYARKVTKEEARIDWSRSAQEIERTIRAFNPEPVAYASLNGTDLRIWLAKALHGSATDQEPGRILAATAQGIDVATGDGRLRILTLQVPGRRPISAADFLNAHPGWKLEG